MDSCSPRPPLHVSDAPPLQAVILAGGLGTRLAPLTLTRPKPIIVFHGRPFLEYLIEMIRDQGIRRVLLLLGYLPDPVIDHFGDGSRFGVSIDYSVTAVENDTGTRLRLAAPQLEREFLLLYCDNYWPMRLDDMVAAWRASRRPAQITFYGNSDGYTRSNLRVGEDGRVEMYDRSRQAPGLAGVDIGFALLQKGVLDLMPEGNCSFEQSVYPQLVAAGRLNAYRTDHRYYSVGSLDRLAATEEFLARRPAVFLDRDGVLNRKMPKAQYVRSWGEWEWLPGALEALRLLKEQRRRVFIITNQPGVARGAMTRAALDEIHSRMCAEALAAGGEIHGIYACTHNWDDGCDCRKPRPGLLFQAQREHALDLSRVPFYGDDERDGDAARAAGSPFVFITPERPLLEAIRS